MAKQFKQAEDDATFDLGIRDKNRNGTTRKAVMSLVGYFISIGDSVAVASDQVDEISDYLLEFHLYKILGFERGNSRCKAKLITAIENIDEVAYPYMDEAARLVLTNIINQI